VNDPQWGKRNNEGPPDLDEIVRRIRRRIGEILGMRGGGGGARGPQGAGMRPLSGGIGLVALILVVAWLVSGFYIVDEGRKGVVLRFGRFHDITTPGPNWHIPTPIESVEVVDTSRVSTVEIGYHGTPKNKVPAESLMLTDDENIIDIQFAVQYTIAAPQDYLFNNRDPANAVKQVAETAIREVVGKHKMDFVLYEGRSEIAANSATLMQQILDRYKTGIRINQVTMQNAQPPEQVQAAFDDAVKAGQDRERQKNEGQAYANDVIPRAHGNASRMIEEANGYAQRVVATAEGDVSRFQQVLGEYQKAPDVTRQRMYLDTVQQVLSASSKVVVDQKPGTSSVIYLPLDKLAGAPPSSAAAVVPPAPSDAAPGDAAQTRAAPAENPAESVARSRDAFRTRDREARP
jgi:modulator of FtsH protease HflK